MKTEYRLVFVDDAVAQKYLEAEDYDQTECFWLLYRFVDGQPVELVATDGGEPEDQTFVRDWNWVPDLLNTLQARIETLEKLARDLGH